MHQLVFRDVLLHYLFRSVSILCGQRLDQSFVLMVGTGDIGRIDADQIRNPLYLPGYLRVQLLQYQIVAGFDQCVVEDNIGTGE